MRNSRSYYLLIFGLLIFALGSFYYLESKKNRTELIGNNLPPLTKNLSRDKEPVVITSTSPIGLWNLYHDKDFAFRYPSDWELKQHTLSGSTKQLIFSGSTSVKDKQFKMSLSVTKSKNFETGTGKVFTSLEDYLNLNDALLTKPVKKIVIDGHPGLQILPRENAKDSNTIVFFSDDKQYIYTVYMRTFSQDAVMIAYGSQIFNNIVSSFIANN